MKAGELMSRSLVSVGPMESVASAARLMQRYDLGALPVCDDAGRLRGMLTDRDITTRCVAADMDAAETGLSQIEEIVRRLNRTRFEVDSHYCEARSLARISSIILREVVNQ